MYRVAMNVSIQYLKQAKKKPATLPLDSEAYKVASSTSGEDAEKWRLIHQQIQNLNLLEKGIVMLYLEGKTYEKIAEIVGISKSNVGTRLMRIKSKLKSRILKKSDIMSLEDLRNVWDTIDGAENRKELSVHQINDILKNKYRSFFRQLLIFETPLLLAQLYCIALVMVGYDQLQRAYLEGLAVVTVMVLLFLIFMRIKKVWNTYSSGFVNNSHSEAFKKLASQKIQSHRFYFLNIIFGFFLVLILIILAIKIYNEYDLIQSIYFWLIIIPSSLFFYSND